jgi:NAD(P)-dependent dehydrogenase (short-subunit alcohol dehydrogenase family)
MKSLDKKVAVITGGNSGIGLASAKALTDAGAKVALFGRDQRTLDQAVATLGERSLGIRGDVASLEDLQRLVNTVKSKFGGIDILFANAGIAEFAPFEQASEEHFDRVFDVNVKGVFRTIQVALPALNSGASIILTTSGANQKGVPATSVYAATKAAVRSLARTLSAELIDRGIRVNAVSPGPVATPIFGRLGIPADAAAQLEAGLVSQVPLKRIAQASEIASVVKFLASSDSSYIVGAEIVADGGMTQL